MKNVNQEKRVSCNLWPKEKNEKYVYKMNHRSRTSNITVEILQRDKSYQKYKKNSLLLRVFLSMKISPLTSVSNK